MGTLVSNKYVRSDFEILQTYEAGIALLGQEVKSLRAGQGSMKGSQVSIRGGEAYLMNFHISPYQKAGLIPGYDPTRSRKLLLKRKELSALYGKIREKGLTMVPLKAYTKGRRIKIELALVRRKKKYEKKEAIKKREIEREMRSSLRG